MTVIKFFFHAFRKYHGKTENGQPPSVHGWSQINCKGEKNEDRLIENMEMEIGIKNMQCLEKIKEKREQKGN